MEGGRTSTMAEGLTLAVAENQPCPPARRVRSRKQGREGGREGGRTSTMPEGLTLAVAEMQPCPPARRVRRRNASLPAKTRRKESLSMLLLPLPGREGEREGGREGGGKWDFEQAEV